MCTIILREGLTWETLPVATERKVWSQAALNALVVQQAAEYDALLKFSDKRIAALENQVLRLQGWKAK